MTSLPAFRNGPAALVFDNPEKNISITVFDYVCGCLATTNSLSCLK